MDRGYVGKFFFVILLMFTAGVSTTVRAQRADENVITAADDAFGTTVGRDSIGLYDPYGVRGFSPTVAGNIRIEGLYFDQKSNLSSRIQTGSVIHIGTAAQGYAFPAPTGIVDISLRPSGATPLLSAVTTFGPYGSRGIELDGQLPLNGTQLTTAVGASYFHSYFGSGGDGQSKSIGVVPRWRPSEHIEVTAFWGHVFITNEALPPFYIPAESSLPPPTKRGQFQGPRWAANNRIGDNAGLLGVMHFGDWTLHSGLFHSTDKSQETYANLFLDITPDGLADHVIVADPPQRSASTSGEARLSRLIKQKTFEHLFVGSLRWRNVAVHYGGSDVFDPGTRVSLNDQLDVAKPVFNFGALTTEHVTQQTAGIAYSLRWDKLAELGLGVQHVEYSKANAQPGLSAINYQTSPWLQNATLAINLNPELVAYGSYTRGLEDSGIAADVAVNRGQPLPVIKSRQYDFGFRWMPSESVKLIVGYFDIVKPYFTIDSKNIERALGDEIHRGVELSLTASPFKGLTIVSGGIFADPRIENVSDANETVGHLPVGQPRQILQLGIDYSLPLAPKISLDAWLRHNSSVAATVDNTVLAPGYTLISLSGRYKFKLNNTPYTLRASIDNATNVYTWLPATAGAYQPTDKSSYSLSLTADF